MQDSYYLSADKATQIHAVKWTPSSEPIAIVQIAHGVTEYIERYAPLAKYLTDRGIIVVGNDHLGHGDSIRRDNTPLTIGSKDTEQYLVDDFYTCYKNTKQEHPNLPYILLGFSLGSFVVRVALDKYPDIANGAIIMGTGQQPALMLSLAQAMAKSEAKKAGGFDHWTEKIDDMALGNYNKKFAPTTSKFDWLCANKAAVDAYDADSKKQDHVTIGIFNAMLELMKIASKPRNIKKIPILFMSGDVDPVGEAKKGVIRAVKAYQKAGLEPEVKFYPGRHDILHEAAQPDVYKDIYDWTQKIIAKQ